MVVVMNVLMLIRIVAVLRAIGVTAVFQAAFKIVLRGNNVGVVC
jgi:hypothetical protein